MCNYFYTWIIFSNIVYFFFIELIVDYTDTFPRYDFHISLGYLKQWFNDSSATTAMRDADRLFYDHLQRYQNVEFGPIEFCIFQNMHHFEIISFLGNARRLTKHAV